MFWGSIIKESKPYKTQSALEDQDYPVLHISNVALPKNAPNGKIYLTASLGGKGGDQVQGLTLATLQKDKVESIALDLYVNVSQQITLQVSGAPGAELHLSGFFEPQREDEDEGMFMDGEEEDIEDDEEGSEEEEGVPSAQKLKKSLQEAKTNALKNVKATAQDSDDEDDEDDYDDEDGEDEYDEESSEEVPKGKSQPPAQAAKPAAPAQQPAKPAAQQQPAKPAQPAQTPKP